MQNWHWQPGQAQPEAQPGQAPSYLTCSLLKDWEHGFFTQQFWPQLPEELVTSLQPTAQINRAQVNRAQTYRVKQVHGDTVLNAADLTSISSSDAEQSSSVTLAEADGLYTSAAHQAIWVCTADCTPVLIGDSQTGKVAAVHAGWRGTAAAIVPKTIAQLQAQGSQIADLRIAMGPAIAGDVYQVSTTVAAQVGRTIVDSPLNLMDLDLEEESGSDLEAVLHRLRQLPDAPVMDDPQTGRARLDVRKVNQLQLQKMGIEPDQISIAPYCTYQQPELFFSYRRDHQKKVQWSGIVGRG